MNKIKVVYIVSTLGRTGPTRQLHNIIKYLDDNLFSAEIISLSPNPINNLEQEFLDIDIPTHHLGLSRFATVIFGIRKLTSILKRLQPDIVHSQGLRSDLLATQLQSTFKSVSTQRNNPLIDYPALMGNIKGTIAARLHVWAFNHLPLVITCSKYIDNTNTNRTHATKVINNGVDLSGLTSQLTTEEKFKKRAQLNLPVDGRLFIYAGPLIPRKNVIMLLQAFSDLEAKTDKLILFREGQLKNECQKLAAEQQNIFI